MRAVTDFYFCAFNDSEKLIMMKARNKLGSATLCGTLLDSASFQDPDKGIIDSIYLIVSGFFPSALLKLLAECRV